MIAAVFRDTSSRSLILSSSFYQTIRYHSLHMRCGQNHKSSPAQMCGELEAHKRSGEGGGGEMGTKKHEPDNLRYGYTCCKTVRIVNYTQLRHVNKLDKQQIQNFVGKPHKNCLLKGRRKGTKLTLQ